MKKLVDFETAKMLKEAGFDLAVINMFFIQEDNNLLEIATISCNGNSLGEFWYSRPDIHNVEDWLRGKGLHVSTDCSIDFSEWYYTIQIKDGNSLEDYKTLFPDHDTALLAGIKEAITILKEQK